MEMILAEETIEKALKNYIAQCSKNEFAKIAGQLLGGLCYYSDEHTASGRDLKFIFKPNDAYIEGTFEEDAIEEGEQ